ncbi:hypothetical protein A2473_01265 [candidate division WWE3 bacterium RIFOXYC2_FULL_42_13]|uniref:Uncharacterized protein n=1 Tax=candidate division WWE3 bacterium TaxID=2053526 RepID=A0A3D0ZPH5_UNCKA|nr:MAG: hypothetical protein US30_C0029G0002 [Candidatus Moranbacteria bacterium GW2011_GWF2_36_839]OGC58373.1 MAG: hypothetical protein A2245_02225 [candidate division WWE3 bacterium RIFOXYA2_FULL_43_12]OGC72160.1 MAG: hypothetical protein A2337_02370 [candidate division WWE3 bacterium RIFOXYB2_FULL_43_9]OGC73643.1 MAG: hypothetical protein A2473_01265 [candidate division WWE3 bacterium RIFOXYC2_FULL_42_13]HBY09695.1 hypothetical protein [candidate division WWE3 bacterium]
MTNTPRVPIIPQLPESIPHIPGIEKAAENSGEIIEKTSGEAKEAAERTVIYGEVLKTKLESELPQNDIEGMEKEIADVNRRAEKSYAELQEDIKNVAQQNGPTESSAAKEPKLNSSAETPTESIKAEVVFNNGEWLIDDIDDETKKWLNSHNYGAFSEEFTSEEKQKAQDYAKGVYENAAQKARAGKHNADENPLEALKKIESNGDDSESMRLLIRIAVRVGIKIATIIAQNISKDKDVPKELRIAAGIFADSLGVVDQIVAGEEHTNLGQDISRYIKERNAAKLSEHGE